MHKGFKDLTIYLFMTGNYREPTERREGRLHDRYYTYTIKACKNDYKGNSKLLHDKFVMSMAYMHALEYKYNVEQSGTQNEHIHALVLCQEYIPNKMLISKDVKFYGFSIKFDIIRREYEADVNRIYSLYMLKEKSDAEKYHTVYGNMFI